jgi:hypothetical protein
MFKSFDAKLVTDVHYRDFNGALWTQKAGTKVKILQLVSNKCVYLDASGRVGRKPKGTFTAVIGKLYFAVTALDFQPIENIASTLLM